MKRSLEAARLFDRLQTIDPGGSDLGAAWFAAAVLTGCWEIRVPKLTPRCCPICWPRRECLHAGWPANVTGICDEVERAAGYYGTTDPDKLPTAVASEIPTNFGLDEGGGSDLARLYGVAWTMMDRAAAYRALALLYRPAEWKGNQPKHLHQTTILARLTDAERELVPRGPIHGRYKSDPLDAVGVGLHCLEGAGLRRPIYYRPPQQFAALVDRVDSGRRSRRRS